MSNNSLFLSNLRVIVAASICDGTIDPSEFKKIQVFIERESKEAATSIKESAELQLESAKKDPQGFCERVLQDLSNATMPLAEKIYLTNSAIETVRTDGLMLSEEIKFIKTLISKLGLTESLIETLHGKWWIIDISPTKLN